MPKSPSPPSPHSYVVSPQFDGETSLRITLEWDKAIPRLDLHVFTSTGAHCMPLRGGVIWDTDLELECEHEISTDNV